MRSCLWYGHLHNEGILAHKEWWHIKKRCFFTKPSLVQTLTPNHFRVINVNVHWAKVQIKQKNFVGLNLNKESTQFRRKRGNELIRSKCTHFFYPKYLPDNHLKTEPPRTLEILHPFFKPLGTRSLVFGAICHLRSFILLIFKKGKCTWLQSH